MWKYQHQCNFTQAERLVQHAFEQARSVWQSHWFSASFCGRVVKALDLNGIARYPMGFPRAGSNPAGCETNSFVPKFNNLLAKLIHVRCGVPTHAIFRLWELKSHALDHSANLTVKPEDLWPQTIQKLHMEKKLRTKRWMIHSQPAGFEPALP